MSNAAPHTLLEFTDPEPIWLPTLRMELASAADDGIMVAFYDAAQEFARESGCLRGQFFVNIGQNLRDVHVSTVVQLEHLAPSIVHRVNLAGLWRRPGHPSALAAAGDSPGSPLWAAMIHPQIIRLYPTPVEDVALGLGLDLSFRLARPYTCIPTFFADAYYEALLSGTLGRMKRQPKRPYSDAEGAKYHLMRFRDQMRIAKLETAQRWGATENVVDYNSDWSNKPGSAYRRTG
jgi:hypothetical protein